MFGARPTGSPVPVDDDDDDDGYVVPTATVRGAPKPRSAPSASVAGASDHTAHGGSADTVPPPVEHVAVVRSNVAGVDRDVMAHAAAADHVSSVPVNGLGGEGALPGSYSGEDSDDGFVVESRPRRKARARPAADAAGSLVAYVEPKRLVRRRRRRVSNADRALLLDTAKRIFGIVDRNGDGSISRNVCAMRSLVTACEHHRCMPLPCALTGASARCP